ncbi:MAG TPA: hypothetical protein DCY27_07795 [Desulfobacterales bacterium]|nr:hypothetical protein [Desulfobacterales bacterium]
MCIFGARSIYDREVAAFKDRMIMSQLAYPISFLIFIAIVNPWLSFPTRSATERGESGIRPK